ncbi:MAG TPA: L-threonylcarbamoyladenylate synthase [Candidatus Saccharimonadales bacterium]|nr:L-threonylcarbamoyladenylate synthase [Candidatus Saccharimonadales bacterium]
MLVSNNFGPDIINTIKKGGVGVIPTDTIYGLVGLALNQDSIQRMYEIKGRDQSKPFIILISSTKELELFGIQLNEGQRVFLKKYWPGKLSVIIPFVGEGLDYLSRGHNTLTFRTPNNTRLINLLEQTGPLAAPSANPEGRPPATNKSEILGYFDDKIDFIVDKETITDSASTLVDLSNVEPVVLRQGDVKI